MRRSLSVFTKADLVEGLLRCDAAESSEYHRYSAKCADSAAKEPESTVDCISSRIFSLHAPYLSS